MKTPVKQQLPSVPMGEGGWVEGGGVASQGPACDSLCWATQLHGQRPTQSPPPMK